MKDFKQSEVRHLKLVLGVNKKDKSPQMYCSEVKNGVTYKFVLDTMGEVGFEEIIGLFKLVKVRYRSPNHQFYIIELAIVEIIQKKHNEVRTDKRSKYKSKNHPIPHDKYWEIKGHR